YLHSEERGHRLDCPQLPPTGELARVAKRGNARHGRCDLFEQFRPFPGQAVFKRKKSSSVAARPRQASDKSAADRIGWSPKYDRDCAGRLLQRSHAPAPIGQYDVGRLSNQLLRIFADEVAIARGMPFLDEHVAADRPAQLLQLLREDNYLGPN